jgi:uncharacterized membrane protein
MPRSAPDTVGDRPHPTAPVPASNPPRPPFARSLPWLLLLGGAIGLAAAFVLTVEKIALIADPTYVPSCSINPVLSCGSVMATPQATVFGFPNSLLGVAGFAVVTTSGAALLAGAQLRRWYWLGLQAGATAGVVFIHWLIFQSLYRIDALCPYCMVVWAVTIPIFWYITLHNLARGAKSLPTRWQSAIDALTRNHTVGLTLWAVTILALIAHRFWSYWSLLLAP